jgi:multicomponent Na+:H+ antiporter subunit B
VTSNVILRVTTKLMLPFVLLFALYVQFFGDFGPGGGFQAGVVIAGAVILYAIVFGIDEAQRVVPLGLVRRMVPAGVMIYAGTGLVALLFGHNYLDYSVLSHDAAHGHEYGIFSIEVGVLVTVSGTMTSIFYAFVERGRP